MVSDSASAGSRRFTLLDALILMTAAAAGCGAVRGWIVLRHQLPQLDNGPLPIRLEGWLDWYAAFRFLLLALSLAMIPIACRGSAEPWRRRFATPGRIVPLAVLTATAATLVDEQGFRFAMGFHYLYSNAAQRLFYVVTDANSIARSAIGVMLAWLALALSGCWRRESDWVGRLGRLLGYGWIGACLGFRGYEVFMYWVHHTVVT